jgi:hypothetical protein
MTQLAMVDATIATARRYLTIRPLLNWFTHLHSEEVLLPIESGESWVGSYAFNAP